MSSNNCEKVELAAGLGVRLLYCKSCEVVEMQIGAISLRLNPDMIQRLANVMMRASLKLDHINTSKKSINCKQPQFIH